MRNILPLGLLGFAAVAGCNTTTTPPVISTAGLAFAGAGTPLTAAQINATTPQIEAVDNAITAGTLTAPTVAPSGAVALHGLVAIESGETVSASLDEVFAIGSLTLTTDILGNSVVATATDFVEYNAGNPNNLVASTTIWGGLNGSLSGTGTASLTSISTSLSGTISTGTGGNLPISATLTGGIYDNNGVLIAKGDMFSSQGDKEGFFIASQ